MEEAAARHDTKTKEVHEQLLEQIREVRAGLHRRRRACDWRPIASSSPTRACVSPCRPQTERKAREQVEAERSETRRQVDAMRQQLASLQHQNMLALAELKAKASAEKQRMWMELGKTGLTLVGQWAGWGSGSEGDGS